MEQLHGTTILSVRRGSRVALGGDGQVTLGNVVLKASARKVRRLYHDRILAGFAGGTADAFTLFERFESKLEKHQGHLVRSAVELAKDEALRPREAGEAAGARKALAAGQVQPFYNPHLLGAGPEKIEAQRAFYVRLLESARCVLFNSGVAGADKLKDLVPPGR